MLRWAAVFVLGVVILVGGTHFAPSVHADGPAVLGGGAIAAPSLPAANLAQPSTVTTAVNCRLEFHSQRQQPLLRIDGHHQPSQCGGHGRQLPILDG
jgi:hypothetical protein